MDITREYFTRIGFVKAVEKLSEFDEIGEETKKLAEEQKPRIKELYEYFNSYRNRHNK